MECCGKWPKDWIQTSKKQDQLERQGCLFSITHQELLDNHELDITKDCYCGRPNRVNRSSITGAANSIKDEKYNFTGSNEEIKQGLDRS